MKKVKRLFAALCAVSIISAAPLSVSADVSSFRMGDLNGDGAVTSADADLLRNALWGKGKLSDVQRCVADLNGDLHVNDKDLQAINALIKAGGTSDEILLNADAAGNVSYYADEAGILGVKYNGWAADIINGASGSKTLVTPSYLSYSSGKDSMFINPYGASFSGDSSKLFYDGNTAASNMKYKGGSVSAYASKDGHFSVTNSFIKNSKSLVKKATDYLSYASQNDAVYAPTNYGVGGTVQLMNAQVIRHEDGYEFINDISAINPTSHSYLTHKYAEMDGVEFYYHEDINDFTFTGVDESKIQFIQRDEREGYEEIALVTDEYIYGLMYEVGADYMAAFVRYEFKTGEAVLAQYTSIVDMATIAVHYSQDGVVEYGMEHPELLIKWLDDYYDPDNLCFQTVMYSQQMKCVQIGKMDDHYKIYDGITYIQLPIGLNQFTANHEGTDTTLSFGRIFGTEVFQMSNPESSVTRSGNAVTYAVGDDSLTMNRADGLLYDPAGNIQYKYSGGSASFKVDDILKLRTPSMY